MQIHNLPLMAFREKINHKGILYRQEEIPYKLVGRYPWLYFNAPEEDFSFKLHELDLGNREKDPEFAKLYLKSFNKNNSLLFRGGVRFDRKKIRGFLYDEYSPLLGVEVYKERLEKLMTKKQITDNFIPLIMYLEKFKEKDII